MLCQHGCCWRIRQELEQFTLGQACTTGADMLVYDWQLVLTVPWSSLVDIVHTEVILESVN